MITFETFRDSVGSAAPPDGLGPAPEALWWAKRGEWGKAHQCVQRHEGERDCDLVHAHLHRQEGDLRNAGGWYRRAGRPMPEAAIEQEWCDIATELLRRP